MGYDVEAVRARFPALAEGAAHFDGAGGSQVPDVVADAVADTLRSAVANRGSVTTAERRADTIVMAARQAIADLLGATSAGVVFGRSMTQLTYELARAMAKGWGVGDEVIVTRLDHDANIRPWVHAAQSAGATVLWADFDRDTGELGVDAVAGLLSTRTRVVAVTGASNLLGSRPDGRAIADAAHAAGALVYVDGVHLTPHSFVDIAELGADFFACSPYKFLGPHLGAVAASPELLQTVHPDKLLPMSDAVQDRPADLGVDGVWLDAGGQQVHLIHAPPPTARGQHFALLVDDLDTAVSELRARDVNVSDPAPVGRSRQSFLNDPAGNLIELHQAVQ